jgi:hypothetical protein
MQHWMSAGPEQWPAILKPEHEEVDTHVPSPSFNLVRDHFLQREAGAASYRRRTSRGFNTALRVRRAWAIAGDELS